MKITDVKAIYPRWRNVPKNTWQYHFWQIVVRVESESGVVGYGYGGGGSPAATVVNTHMKELIVGRTIASPRDISETWDWLYYKSLPYGRTGIPIMALSGLDLALWDMLGKEQNKPVYDLIGGLKASPVRAYASSTDFQRDRDTGYTAVKIGTPFIGQDGEIDHIVEKVATAREIYGKDGLILTDCGMTWDASDALKMAGLMADYDVYWFEDVLTPDHLEELAELRSDVKPILLAGGEHDFTHHNFVSIAKANALDLWQPDVTWCGGITAGLRIVQLAREVDVPVIPHRGGEIWGLHLLAATGCGNLAETMPLRWTESSDLEFHSSALWLDEPWVSDGYIAPLDRPGFGVELNQDML